jgi:hypothetical protein
VWPIYSCNLCLIYDVIIILSRCIFLVLVVNKYMCVCRGASEFKSNIYFNTTLYNYYNNNKKTPTKQKQLYCCCCCYCIVEIDIYLYIIFLYLSRLSSPMQFNNMQKDLIDNAHTIFFPSKYLIFRKTYIFCVCVCVLKKPQPSRDKNNNKQYLHYRYFNFMIFFVIANDHYSLI